MGGGSKSDDGYSRIWIPEAGDWACPIVVTEVATWRICGPLLAPLDETRAKAADVNFARQALKRQSLDSFGCFGHAFTESWLGSSEA